MLSVELIVPEDILVKLRRSHAGLGWAIEEEERDTGTERGRPCEDRGRNVSDTTSSSGTPRIASHHQKKQGRGKEGGHPQSLQKEPSPADTFILDFQSPEL